MKTTTENEDLHPDDRLYSYSFSRFGPFGLHPSPNIPHRSMSPHSPYSPDRSLQIAVAVLAGGGLLVAAAVYLLTTSTGHFTGRQVAEGTAPPQQSRSVTGRPARRAVPLAPSGAASGRAQPLSPLPGRGAARAGSGAPAAPSRSPTRNAYDLRPDRREEVVTGLRPDMSHADLGAPSGGAAPGRSTPGTARAGAGAPSDKEPDAGSAPQGADLGTRSSSASSGAGAEWRSEASELGRQARALSGALAHLDRSGRSADEPPRSDGSSSALDGDASTAATDRGPRAASDPPDPPPPPPQVPVDGGLGWLAAAGAAYAANRLRKKAEEEGHADA